jgi:hypothetical protein
LYQHASPIAFKSGTGVNDELDGSESKSPVRFTVPNQFVPRGITPKPLSELSPEEQEEAKRYEMECEVMQSLAKWKRIMLGRLNVDVGEGIYCSSTSIRKGYKGKTYHCGYILYVKDFGLATLKHIFSFTLIQEMLHIVSLLTNGTTRYVSRKKIEI